MNAKFVTFVGLFALGALTGSLTTYFVTKKKLSAEHAEELAALRGWMHDKVEEEHNRVEAEIVEAYENQDILSTENEHDREVMIQRHMDALAKLSGGFVTFAVQNEDGTYSPQADDAPVEQSSDIYEISQQEFVDNDQYEQLTINYYIQNSVFVNENLEPMDIDDVEAAIGHFVNLVKTEKNDVYIRNDSKRTDYELLAIDEMYEEE